QPAISSDGRYVAFTAVVGAWRTVLVRDMSTDGLTDVGAPAIRPSLSGDGRYVVFDSFASIGGSDTNNRGDVFVKDTETGSISIVSEIDGGEGGIGDSWDGSISADGRYVAFVSNASNLVFGDNNGDWDIFVKDLQTGALVRASTGSAGEQLTGQSSFGTSAGPSISSDGHYVVFEMND